VLAHVLPDGVTQSVVRVGRSVRVGSDEEVVPPLVKVAVTVPCPVDVDDDDDDDDNDDDGGDDDDDEDEVPVEVAVLISVEGVNIGHTPPPCRLAKLPWLGSQEQVCRPSPTLTFQMAGVLGFLAHDLSQMKSLMLFGRVSMGVRPRLLRLIR
jgi:hypothetical protein